MRALRLAAHLATLALLLGLPAAAAADGLPLRWEIETTDSGWLLEIEALEALEDVRAEVTLEPDTGPSRTLLRERVGNLAVDTPRTLRFAAPPATGRVRIAIEGRHQGERLRSGGEFTWAPTATLQLRAEVPSWDPERPGIRVQAQGAARVELEVRDESNEPVLRLQETADPTAPFDHTFTWDPPASTLLIEVRAHGPDGSSAWERFVPWQFEISVEDVQFPTGSAEIPASEEPRLRETLAEIRHAWERVRPWIDVELYVAGYTDTVGSADANRRLSEARAQALGAWLRAQGLEIPIRIRGFGQQILAFPTPDGVDEPRNRRALFVLAMDPPTGPQFPAGSWRALPAR